MRDPVLSPLPPGARRGPGQRLRDQLCEAAGGACAVLAESERSWASATFSGTRHRFTLGFVGTDAVACAERLVAALPDHEFAIPGHLVADATVIALDHVLLPEPRLTLTCELLLLEDR